MLSYAIQVGVIDAVVVVSFIPTFLTISGSDIVVMMMVAEVVVLF